MLYFYMEVGYNVKARATLLAVAFILCKNRAGMRIPCDPREDEEKTRSNDTMCREKRRNYGYSDRRCKLGR